MTLATPSAPVRPTDAATPSPQASDECSAPPGRPDGGNLCLICQQPIAPSGKRGRPRTTHLECVPERQRRYREANKEKVAEYQRPYRERRRRAYLLDGHGTHDAGCRCDICSAEQAERELGAL